MNSCTSDHYIRLFILIVCRKYIMFFMCILLAIILIISRIYTFGGILMKPVWLRRPSFRLKWDYGSGVPLLYSHNKFQEPEC
jgi:hypothetical protein